ncbi:MAG: DUF2489 domain-containing protein [Ketobacteraceae bacterium]|nr:DUF2489 domain-containing protein [Ketobacteraceae bacterium]
MVTALAVAGGLIIVVLGVIAWRMWQKVWDNEKRIREYQAEVEQNEQKRLAYIHESINVIAAAVLDDQVRVAEAGIRMAVLLDNLPLSCDSKHRFKPLFDIYNRSRHIPTHSKWEALEKKERRAFERELQGIEREFESQVKEIASHIKQNPFGNWQFYEVKH